MQKSWLAHVAAFCVQCCKAPLGSFKHNIICTLTRNRSKSATSAHHTQTLSVFNYPSHKRTGAYSSHSQIYLRAVQTIIYVYIFRYISGYRHIFIGLHYTHAKSCNCIPCRAIPLSSLQSLVDTFATFSKAQVVSAMAAIDRSDELITEVSRESSCYRGGELLL